MRREKKARSDARVEISRCGVARGGDPIEEEARKLAVPSPAALLSRAFCRCFFEELLSVYEPRGGDKEREKLGRKEEEHFASNARKRE